MTKPFIASRRRRAGFSLVEMIGVLAIIAILAVVIVPKVFSTIASSRVTSAVGSITSVKSAVAEFVGKYGTLPTTNNNSRLDSLLLSEGFLESPFVVKIGNQPPGTPNAPATWSRNATTGLWAPTGGAAQTGYSRIISVNANTASIPGANGTNYNLTGVAGGTLPAGSRVVSAVLVGVSAKDAWDLSQRIDGDALSETDTSTADARGRVAYTGTGATRTVYVYIAHQ